MINKIPQFQKENFTKFIDDIKYLSGTIDCKKPLFLAGVHGDECIGVEAIKNVNKKQKVDWILGNERAYETGARFIEVDLNRSGPGYNFGALYEERRAFEIIKKFADHDAVIDLHGSKSDVGIFVILTKPSIKDLQLALQFDISNIVVWPPSTKRDTGPLVEFAEPGIEIEAGPKNEEQTQLELEKVILGFLNKKSKSEISNKNIYWVYGKQKEKIEGLINFELYKTKDDEFYPLLVDEYDFPCYKMLKIN